MIERSRQKAHENFWTSYWKNSFVFLLNNVIIRTFAPNPNQNSHRDVGRRREGGGTPL